MENAWEMGCWHLIEDFSCLDNLEHQDLRRIGRRVLQNSDEMAGDGGVVLQVTEVIDVARPASSSAAVNTRPLLVIELTDGHTAVRILLLCQIPGLTMDTAPGAKVLVRSKRALCLMLEHAPTHPESEPATIVAQHSDDLFRVLGGAVAALVAAKESQRRSLSSKKGFAVKQLRGS